MSSERSPLLHQEVTQQRSAPRPDLRNSPENVIVDGSDTHSSEGKKTFPAGNKLLTYFLHAFRA